MKIVYACVLSFKFYKLYYLTIIFLFMYILIYVPNCINTSWLSHHLKTGLFSFFYLIEYIPKEKKTVAYILRSKYLFFDIIHTYTKIIYCFGVGSQTWDRLIFFFYMLGQIWFKKKKQNFSLITTYVDSKHLLK